MSIQQVLKNKHWIRALLSRVAQPIKVGTTTSVLDSFLLNRRASRGPDRGLVGLFFTAETELRVASTKRGPDEKNPRVMGFRHG